MTENVTLWLDDERNPTLQVNYYLPNVVWIKSYNQFVEWILEFGLPQTIWFDHDLGDFEPELIKDVAPNEKTGYDALEWLIQYCKDNDKNLPLCYSQSANFAGRRRILARITDFRKYKQ